MLNVWLGTRKDSMQYPSVYFDDAYEQSWLESQLAKDIIKGIDLSEYLMGEIIMSPALGAIPPRDLSTGCKSCLILLNEPDRMICGEKFGDNCFPWLFKIGEEKDITITLSHIPRLQEHFEMMILNSNKIVKDPTELLKEILRLGRVGGLCNDPYNS